MCQSQKSDEASQEKPRAEFRVGTVTGFGHGRIGNQDCFDYFSLQINNSGKKFRGGIVSDGCTNKKLSKASGGKYQSRSDVGSALLTQLAVKEIENLLIAGIPLKDIPSNLFPRLLAGMSMLADLFSSQVLFNRAMFLERFFYCTLLGFIEDGEDLVIFSAGDGVILVNEEIFDIDQNNKPHYPVYNILPAQTLSGVELQREFAVKHYRSADVQKVGILSDGITSVKSNKGQIEPEDLDMIWNFQPTVSKGLQNWLNKRQFGGTWFEDDTTGVLLNMGDRRMK